MPASTIGAASRRLRRTTSIRRRRGPRSPSCDRITAVPRQDTRRASAELSASTVSTRRAGTIPRSRCDVVRASDAEGYARADDWSPGLADGAGGTGPFRQAIGAFPFPPRPPVPMARHDRSAALRQASVPTRCAELNDIVAQARAGAALGESTSSSGCSGRATTNSISFAMPPTGCDGSDAGEVVRYVVNRNINYTNICSYRCTFCAFSKGSHAHSQRGAPYELPLEEIARRVAEAWERGATEVCMQGGIHPEYTGETYLAIVRAAQARRAADPRARLYAARGEPRRRHARADGARVPARADRGGTRHACPAPPRRSSTTRSGAASVRTR